MLKILLTFSFLLLWGMLRWMTALRHRNCGHTHTDSRSLVNTSGGYTHSCGSRDRPSKHHVRPRHDEVSSYPRGGCAPQLTRREKGEVHHWRKCRLCSPSTSNLLPPRLHFLTPGYPPPWTRDACPLSVVIFGRNHRRAVLHLKKRGDWGLRPSRDHRSWGVFYTYIRSINMNICLIWSGSYFLPRLPVTVYLRQLGFYKI